jgi:hypothetical protein
MSGRFITRQHKAVVSVTVAAAVANSTEIDIQEFSGGTIYIPSGGPSETWTVYAKDPSDGTYLALQDKDGNTVTLIVAASEAHEMDPAIFACQFIKLTGAIGDVVSLTLKG